jgi:hypothetical protein
MPFHIKRTGHSPPCGPSVDYVVHNDCEKILFLYFQVENALAIGIDLNFISKNFFFILYLSSEWEKLYINMSDATTEFVLITNTESYPGIY